MFREIKCKKWSNEIKFPMEGKKNFLEKWILYKWESMDKLMGEQEEDYYEPSCSACGDGGCIHCEPSRFIEGYIY